MLPRRYCRLLASPGSAEPRVLNPLLRQARSPTVQLIRRHLASALVTLVFAEVSGQVAAFHVTVDRCAFYCCRFLGWQNGKQMVHEEH
ncbi:uncharacterized protein [Zea mays]|uniref:uncharacterized protein LOC100274130 isoform 2 n=1 Tax=Zea mays TaxID=4577 RepID=UPI0004DE8322|nr:uncharacterized protein LOC100274130 isoform 2 [Zea mays]XP_008668258.1 uncharacterized protein LOC100274130 isoform X2 [Zea mays]|eukprot:XP_008668258.1 uncharacterized protein LOC100274130 isoform X2 [Zea mays]